MEILEEEKNARDFIEGLRVLILNEFQKTQENPKLAPSPINLSERIASKIAESIKTSIEVEMDSETQVYKVHFTHTLNIEDNDGENSSNNGTAA